MAFYCFNTKFLIIVYDYFYASRSLFFGLRPFIGAFLLAFLAFALPAWGDTAALIKTDSTEKTVIGPGVSFIEDPEGVLTFADVQKPSLDWQINTEGVFNQGYNKSSWWLRFTVENTQYKDLWLLEIAYAVLDNLDVYVVSQDGGVKEYFMGDQLPFGHRPVNHRHFVVPLELKKSEQATFYIRLKTNSSVQLPMALSSNSMFREIDVTHTLLEGIWVGGLLIIALYNFLMFLVLRSRDYLYYVANIFSVMFFVLCLHGWGYQYLWPEAIAWNDKSVLIFLSFILISSWIFTGSFLNVYAISRFLRISQIVGILLVSLVGAFVLYVPYDVAIRVIIPVAVVSCFWGFLCAIASWLQGNTSARYYMLAWSVFLAGGVVLALNKFHYLPLNLLTNFAIQIGSLLDVLLFSLALADRFNKERALRLEAEREALLIQKKANETLERRVEQRTQDLEIANQKLQELSDTDQLLGIYNRRFLDGALEKTFLSSLRRKHNMAVLLADVDHFKGINDTHGHLVGDECLKAVTQRLQQHVRLPGDIIARYGGEEFCIILPETTMDDALDIAERIRICVASDPIFTSVGPLVITVSLGVSASVPRSGETPLGYLDSADMALYRAKNSGRNCVKNSADVLDN